MSKAEKIVEELKQERISSVQEFLDKHSDSELISLHIPGKDAPKNEGSEPVFEVKYSVKAKKKAKEE